MPTFTGPYTYILQPLVDYTAYFIVNDIDPVIEWLDVCEWLRPTSEIVEVR